MLKRLFIFSILLIAIMAVHAQQQYWQHFTKADGLPTNNLRDIAFELPNSIWIASDSGLINFDGQQFTTYNRSNSNLPSNNINELEIFNYELWLASDSGLSVFDGRSFRNFNSSNGLLSNQLTGLAQDTNGILWIGSPHGVSRYDGLRFTHDSGRSAAAIAVDDSNRVYILKYSVVFNLPNFNRKIYEVFDGQQWSSPPVGNFSDNYRSEFYKTEDGRLYLAPHGGGNSHYVEITYPFHLHRRLIIPPHNVQYTPHFITEYQGFRWIGYAGQSTIYRSLIRDSNYQALPFLKPPDQIRAMDFNANKVAMATNHGFVYGNSDLKLPSVSEVLDINELRARVNIFGPQFNTTDDGSAAFEYPPASNRHTVLNGDFQLGIKKNKSQIDFLIFPRELDRQNYLPGPLSQRNLFRSRKFMIKISKAEIDYHRQNYQQAGYIMPDAIEDWPANADSNLANQPELAPFFDANSNGCYDPTAGDYPIIKGDQAIYWINHPTDKNIPLEYHWMIYAFNRPQDTALRKAAFLQLRLINRDSSRIDYIKAGFHLNADIGYPHDDYNGSDSLRNCIYFYNGDLFDESPPPYTGYGNNPPALGLQMLSDSMTSAVFYQSRGLGQSVLNWTALHGLNGDSSRFYDPIANRTTTYQFPGDPLFRNGWSEFNLSPTFVQQNNPGDRKGLAAIPHFSLNPGESKTIELSIFLAQGAFRQVDAAHIPILRRRADEIRSVYDTLKIPASTFVRSFPCGKVVGTEESKREIADQLKIYPNPSNGILHFSSDKLVRRIQLFSIDGRLLNEQRVNSNLGQLDFSHLEKGLYLLRMEKINGQLENRKLLLLH